MHNYPRDPDGLDWTSFDLRGAIVDALRGWRPFDGDAIKTIAQAQAAIEAGPERAIAATTPGASRYVGVSRCTVRKPDGRVFDGFRAQSPTRGGKRWTGTFRPGAEGELRAAWDYARYMGLDAPIERQV